MQIDHSQRPLHTHQEGRDGVVAGTCVGKGVARLAGLFPVGGDAEWRCPWENSLSLPKRYTQSGPVAQQFRSEVSTQEKGDVLTQKLGGMSIATVFMMATGRKWSGPCGDDTHVT